MRGALLSLLVLALLTLPAVGGEEPPDLQSRVRACVQAENGADRLALALALADDADPEAVLDALRGAWSWPADAPKGEVTTWTRRTPDGTTHTILAYAPSTYAPDHAWPALVWLHGAVARDEDGGGGIGIEMFRDEAEKKGFVLIAPSTQNGAHWWSPSGAALIRGALLDAKRRWRIDADRVALAGFSDGGSGAYHLLAHDPTPYACFLPMMGNPLVSRILGGPVCGPNLASRPVWAVNGGQDPLYPSEKMKPVVDAMREAGADIHWIDEPESSHEPSFLERRWEEAWQFVTEHPRVALPKDVRWASAAPDVDGRFSWVEIVALDPHAPADPALEPAAVLPVPDLTPSPRLGIVLDPRFDGDGIRVGEVQDGTPAAEAGFQAGDVIVKVGDSKLEGDERLGVLRTYLNVLSGGTTDGTFVVRRGDEEVEVHARPRVLDMDRAPQPAELGYGVEPGIVHAKLAGPGTIEVGTRGVSRLRLHLAPELVDLSKELVVTVNGAERYRGVPVLDVATLLGEACERGPGAPRYAAVLDFAVKP